MVERLNSLNGKLFLVAVCWLVQTASCSQGDRSEAFLRCVHFCTRNNCSSSAKAAFYATRPWYLTLTRWSCFDECEYDCMWQTVEVFRYHGLSVPQFHGKWPFYRFYGVQEPASVLFSILNGISHYVMWQKLKRAVQDSQFCTLWNIQALLSINAWFWSAVFHARDTPLTEKLDYFCAFSLVLNSFYCLFIRILSTHELWNLLAIAVPFLAFFVYHIHYLAYVHFDYGYNMKANVVVGLLNSFGWLLWCYRHRYKRYVWRCAASVVVINLLLLLELCDFPPWNFFIDAHALWHLGTIPVPLLWYRFLIEDCLDGMNNHSTFSPVSREHSDENKVKIEGESLRKNSKILK